MRKMVSLFTMFALIFVFSFTPVMALDINTILPSTKYTGTSTSSYFLELNPNLSYKNCHAYGTIKVSD